jgi:hypothetical protein
MMGGEATGYRGGAGQGVIPEPLQYQPSLQQQQQQQQQHLHMIHSTSPHLVNLEQQPQQQQQLQRQYVHRPNLQLQQAQHHQHLQQQQQLQPHIQQLQHMHQKELEELQQQHLLQREEQRRALQLQHLRQTTDGGYLGHLDIGAAEVAFIPSQDGNVPAQLLGGESMGLVGAVAAGVDIGMKRPREAGEDDLISKRIRSDPLDLLNHHI